MNTMMHLILSGAGLTVGAKSDVISPIEGSEGVVGELHSDGGGEEEEEVENDEEELDLMMTVRRA